ncbi:cyclic di-AMP binding protein CbpA [Holzapfeliella sp. He02]|uniref:Cyclic di-AMP binding protein CbpA n=1 Tax=Holzapfeliella saturejae TaxID=3082953 RepID=A0ABU8SFB1_9LACO
MLLKSLVLKKEFLTTINEKATLEEALTILEESGYRCVPIVDDSGKIFRGNIYKMHIYRHKSRGGDMTLPVTHLLKNATKTIQVNSPFFQIFFNIKDLPYIAVLDEENHFYGILTHAKLLSMLSDAWNIHVGSYVLTILSAGEQGELAKMTKIVSKYSSIAGCVVLDANKNDLIRRTLITLPAGITTEKLDIIIDKLEKKGFAVPSVEDLQTGQTIRDNEISPDEITEDN